jgi:Plasmid replication region DNA-binding N-term
MSESIPSSNEKEIMTEDEMNEISTKKATNELSLRERVFQACKQFENENKEITCEAVRKITKGSERNVSKYIKDWDDNKNGSALTVQNSSYIEIQSELEMVQTTEETVQTVLNSYNQQHNIDADEARKRGAERYVAIRAGEEEIIQFLFDNPDKLPEPYKQKLEEITNASKEKMNARSAKYEVDFFITMVLESIQ